MKAVESQLIELLGETDALFAPIRDWSNPAAVTAILEMRSDFRRRGLPIPRAGGSAESRKRIERLFDQIEQSRLAIFRRTNGRRTHWRLADVVDWQLRHRCGQSGFDEAMTVLLIVDELTRRGHTNGGYVPDWSIALSRGDGGRSAKSRDWVAYAGELALPALVRNWLVSWSDLDGACGYRLTNEGRAFLAEPQPPITTIWPNYNVDAHDAYFAALDDALAELKTMKPKHENAVAIPLSAGDWPSAASRAGIPAVFDRRGEVRSPQQWLRALARNTKAKNDNRLE